MEKYEIIGTGISRDCRKNYEDHDAPDSREEELLNAAKRRRLMILEEQIACMEDIEICEMIETVVSSGCRENNKDEPLPENTENLDKIENESANQIQDHHCTSSTDSPWPPETPRSKLAGRPQSVELESEPEQKNRDVIEVRLREQVIRFHHLITWLNCSQFDNAEEQKVARNVRPNSPSTSNYGADLSDYSDRFVSFMVNKSNRKRQLTKNKFNCIKLWPEPMSDRAQVMPAYEPESTCLKEAFSQSSVNTTMRVCDVIPGLMVKIVQFARIGKFQIARSSFENPKKVRGTNLRSFLGGYVAELSEYSDGSFMTRRYNDRQEQRNCNVIIRWTEPRTGVAQVFPAYEPINTRFKGAFSESKIHETMRVCDMIPGFLSKIVQIGRIGKFGAAGRLVDY